MSLNEVNWRNVMCDHKSFPPDVEFLVNNKDKDPTVSPQKFLCHKLLLATVSPVFQAKFFSDGSRSECGFTRPRLVVRIEDCNPSAFQKMLEFIYYQKPYKLNSLRQAGDMEGIGLLMDTMELAVRYKLGKLMSFCEETANRTVVITNQNFKEVQTMMMSHHKLGKIKTDLCEKFGSVVFTRICRDRQDLDGLKKREIVESEVERFSQGLDSHVMSIMSCKRSPDSDSGYRSPSLDTPPVRKMSRENDVVILQKAPASKSPITSTIMCEASAFLGTPSRLPKAKGSSKLGPFPSPVPTSTLQSELSPSSSLSSVASHVSTVASHVSSITPLDLWAPRSTSTPILAGVASVPVSTKMLRSILSSVANSSNTTKAVDDAVFTKEELKTLVLRFKDLSRDEKQELLEYLKMMEVKDPELIKSVRNETMNYMN